MDSKAYIEHLFQKYLADDISIAELEELYAYFGGEKHPELIRQLIRQHIAQDRYDTTTEQQQQAKRIEEAAWPTVKARIAYMRIEYKPQVFNMKRWLPYVAAAIVLATVSIALYVYLTKTGETTESMRAANDIPPGEYRAVLKLDDGSELELSGAQEGIVSDGEAVRYEDGSNISGSAQASRYLSLQTPRAGQYRVTLPDGTKVWLNAASELRYPAAFQGRERTVELSGEAYFDVSEHSGQPFVVKTGQQRITVLGTQFNINAYPEETRQYTTLVNGKVQVNTADGSHTVTINPGQQAITTADSRISVKAVDPTEYTGWVDGVIILSNNDLAETLRQLERWYDVTFEEVPPTARRVDGLISRNAPLQDVLDLLQLNYNVEFKIEGRRVRMQQR